MYGDPHQIRVLARRVHAQGEQLREEAHDLVTRARVVGWTGLAGETMAAQTVAQSVALELVADRHAAAARALERHARAVEELLALIAEIERRVRAAVDGARSRLRRFLDGLLDALDPTDEVLAHFTPPPPGSAAWLDVRLPGVPLPAVPLR